MFSLAGKTSQALVAMVSILFASQAVLVSSQSCGTPLGPKQGKVKDWYRYENKQPAKDLATGQGSCGFDYRDSSNAVCLNPGWYPAATDANADQNPCGRWVDIKYKDRRVQARVSDSCPGTPCTDIWLSKRLYQYLGGDVDLGNFDADIEWTFLNKEPWWACLAGLDGNLYGPADDCKGNDDFGCPRDGRRTGDDRVVGAKAYDFCPKFPDPYQFQDSHHQMPQQQT